MKELKEGATVSGVITGITDEGVGVMHAENGMVIFVPFTVRDDEIKAKILKVGKRVAYGEIISVLKPSKYRQEAGCPYYEKCGGCSLRHMSYEEELYQKREWVKGHVERIGGISMDIPEVLPSPNVSAYRNKAILPAGTDGSGKIYFGYYERKSHRLVDVQWCALLHPAFSNIVSAVAFFANETKLSAYDENSGKGLLRAVFLRRSEDSGKTVLTLVINGNALPKADMLIYLITNCFPNVSGVVLNINKAKTNVVLGKEYKTLYGSPILTDVMGNVRLSISPASFYQVNKVGADILYSIAGDFAGLTGEETLLDLYCGAGSVGLSMAKKVKRLIGVEIVSEAIENAKENAKNNKVSNASFFVGDAEIVSEKLNATGEHPDVVVIDPPRKGASIETLTAVAKMNPKRIVMISCNTATMARDMKALATMGYTPTKIAPVDMFPRTANVECVLLMTRA